MSMDRNATFSVRRLIAAPMMLAFALVLTLALPLPTSAAHDDVIDTEPVNGQTVETVPDAIRISFTDTPVALGSRIQVEDADGTDWTVGEVEIGPDVAVQRLDPAAPAGMYTVTWRVVSSDSHPIEGAFEFAATAGDRGATVTTAPPPVAPPTNEPVPEATAVEQASPAPGALTEQPDSSFPTTFLIVLGVVLVVLLGLVGVLLRRRTR